MAASTAHPLREGLCRPEAYPHPVTVPVRVIETHISLVFLTGEYVYKLKKPVNLGFVDYSTLEKRRHFCAEEVRLNRRLAAPLYLGVAAITGSERAPRVRIDGEAGGQNAGPAGEPTLEYAVRMREFPQSAQLDRMLEAGTLEPTHVDTMARQVAKFHARAAQARPGDGVGGVEQVRAAVLANFELTARFVPELIPADTFRRVREWSEARLAALEARIAARLADGFVRECHGDLHLQNAAWVDGELQLFDCIEFNPAFRFTDVMAEVAFTRMDLDARGRPELGARFLNLYLEHSGDYAGLALLPLYLSYRAWVRAKVAALTPVATGFDAATRTATVGARVALSDAYTRPPRPWLALMHGVTGSGKTHFSNRLVEGLGAVRIRSDAERKRLAGMGREHHAAAVGEGLYGAATTDATYQRLHQLAAQALEAGFPVVLDATYLKAARRQAAREVAERAGVPCLTVSCEASPEVLAERVTKRAALGVDLSDATLEVLEQQWRDGEPLVGPERATALVVDTRSQTADEVAQRVRDWLQGHAPAGGCP
ncbi:MAG: AAA family ATPase [Nitrospirota bacterium]|nr:AAA family ATPase [Nitrospirota bacterium]